MEKKVGDVVVSKPADFVALLEIQRAPNNHFDHALILDLADIFTEIDNDDSIRTIVLASDGKHFCAGANFSPTDGRDRGARPTTSKSLYQEAVRLFNNKKQIVAAVQGAAVGGGLGLCLVADFRVGCLESRFTANFVKLGFSPGFGLTHTLEKIVGFQKAQDMIYTGRRVKGDEALQIGLLDRMVPLEQVREAAISFASEIAENAPMSLISARNSLRRELMMAVTHATEHESSEQGILRLSNDYQEGIKAVAERRPGNWTGT